MLLQLGRTCRMSKPVGQHLTLPWSPWQLKEVGAPRDPHPPLSAPCFRKSWVVSPAPFTSSPSSITGTQATPLMEIPTSCWVNPCLPIFSHAALNPQVIDWYWLLSGCSYVPDTLILPLCTTRTCSQLSYKLLIADPNRLEARFLNKQQGLTSTIK